MVRFRIVGDLRYLSHIETMSLFRRACVRAGLNMAYSRGYNPRPKLSLPLPRTVGVESDDDLLCLHVEEPESDFDIEKFKADLSEQLPAGCEVISVKTVRQKHCPVPRGAFYKFVLREFVSEDEQNRRRLRKVCKDILTRDSMVIQRRFGEEGSKAKNIDVRSFVKDIEVVDDGVVVECNISGMGTIRVEEIMEILQIRMEDLSVVRRERVQWQLDN